MPLSRAPFGVLSDNTRLRIVEELRSGERSVGTLVSRLAVCQPGVSRHLRILHRAGFVRVRADGQRRLYSLRSQPFRDLDRWIQDYRELVEGRLDRVGDLLESEPSDPSGSAESRSSPRERRRD